jgi:hypothetical protein
MRPRLHSVLIFELKTRASYARFVQCWTERGLELVGRGVGGRKCRIGCLLFRLDCHPLPCCLELRSPPTGPMWPTDMQRRVSQDVGAAVAVLRDWSASISYSIQPRFEVRNAVEAVNPSWGAVRSVHGRQQRVRLAVRKYLPSMIFLFGLVPASRSWVG